MTLFYDIFVETLRTLLQAAPYLLLGLLMAGFVHVLFPEQLIRRWMGRPGMSGVVRAAAIGVPLPVCSCGVVPITVELRRKGASKPASLSFLTTTPESSIDSILFTWGLMGPLFAIARPVAAFLTALVGGAGAIAYLDEDEPAKAAAAEAAEEPCDTCAPEEALGSAEAPEALAALKAWVPRVVSTRQGAGESGAGEETPGLWRSLVRPALRYGFIELLDDLAFWLALGVVIAGVLGAVLPADLADRGLGGGIVPMLILLAVGIPLYMCASASTPVAAALLAKGVGPGAALVFLLAGPATNAATVVMLGRTFGGRFVRVYLASVMGTALACGLLFEALLGPASRAQAPLAAETAAGIGSLEGLSFVVLSVLLVWRLWKGGFRIGMRELRVAFRELFSALGGAADERGRRRRKRLWTAVFVFGLVGLYLAAGLRSVPPESRGYGFLFGSLEVRDAEPGLHYFPPSPFGRWETRRAAYPRKADVGFRTDLELLAQRRDLVRFADPNEWHSPVSAMNANRVQASYITADENLVEMSFTVHYDLSDPAAFFYRVDHRHDFVVLYAEASARRFLAGRSIDDLLTVGRPEIEKAIGEAVQESLDGLGAGVAVTSVHVVDIHPPGEAVFSFRDVSSAREDKETRIHRARELLAGEVPRARGQGEKILVQARADAEAKEIVAGGRAKAFAAKAEAAAGRRRLLQEVLWLETAERILAEREKFVVPPGSAGRGISLWRDDLSLTPQQEVD